MGYTTEFRGNFDITPPLTAEQVQTLTEFAETRHEPSPLGKHWAHYCQWEPSADGTVLRWDGGEKFYYYIEWLEYLITAFFIPWGCKLNGIVRWRGEEFDDMGQITVTDNLVEAKHASR